jgi:asparagine synthase (glutamine-hydrolysing)
MNQVCGVCGVFQPSSRMADLTSVLEDMTVALRHRGPDYSDVWVAPSGEVAFGHSRLAIVDLSQAGSQPMSSANGRWTITYNGEIYNSDALRDRLPSVRWRGHSDTEVLVEHIARHGVSETLRAAKGMFAFGCWDAKESELWLARDRFGEKPLYYGQHQGSVIFASELKALRAIPGFNPDIDRQALAEYFRWTNVPSPMTIYEGVHKLPPAHYLRVSDRAGVSDPEPYWSVLDVAGSASSLPDGVDAVDHLETVLDEAVHSQMISDVPLGAFLSGGLDSSSVVASMQRQSSDAVRTFTIGFSEASYDESGYAAEVAAALGTDHTDLVVSPDDAMRVIPDLPRVFDEPFADSSQIPTYLVSQMARKHVTVALSGDGGDELFGGYDRYQQVERLERLRRVLPGSIRRTLGATVERLPVDAWDRLGRLLPSPMVPSGLRHRTGYRMHKVARLLVADGAQDVYASLMSIENRSDGLVLAALESVLEFAEIPASKMESMSPFERAMLIDTLTYLPGDLLTKVDRASMAVGLEVRVPFLDPDLFRFAWGLPHDHRVRKGQGKWVLRELLRRSLPDYLIDRPKMGFGVPIGHWLRGPLRSWADELLDPVLVKEQGFLDPTAVHQRWTTHRDGRADLTHQIWSLLMFQAWLVEETG